MLLTLVNVYGWKKLILQSTNQIFIVIRTYFQKSLFYKWQPIQFTNPNIEKMLHQGS